ncbi:MAG: hypothetical protein PHG69_05105, partial [Candidatus Omnitrophica bacterium]|nr:hypothetical protein [Candidatus Omnitrophota bacterium]
MDTTKISFVRGDIRYFDASEFNVVYWAETETLENIDAIHSVFYDADAERNLARDLQLNYNLVSRKISQLKDAARVIIYRHPAIQAIYRPLMQTKIISRYPNLKKDKLTLPDRYSVFTVSRSSSPVGSERISDELNKRLRGMNGEELAEWYAKTAFLMNGFQGRPAAILTKLSDKIDDAVNRGDISYETLFNYFFVFELFGREYYIPQYPSLSPDIMRNYIRIPYGDSLSAINLWNIIEPKKKSQETFFLGFCGGFGSGKTVFSQKIADLLTNIGLRTQFISSDDYLRPRTERKDIIDPRKLHQMDLFTEHLGLLKQKLPFRMPRYDFREGISKEGDLINSSEVDVVIFEGQFIFVLEELRDLFDVRVFIDQTAFIRAYRRTLRDHFQAGLNLDEIAWKMLVRQNNEFKSYVRGSVSQADIILSSFGQKTEFLVRRGFHAEPEYHLEGIIRDDEREEILLWYDIYNERFLVDIRDKETLSPYSSSPVENRSSRKYVRRRESLRKQALEQKLKLRFVRRFLTEHPQIKTHLEEDDRVRLVLEHRIVFERYADFRTLEQIGAYLGEEDYFKSRQRAQQIEKEIIDTVRSFSGDFNNRKKQWLNNFRRSDYRYLFPEEEKMVLRELIHEHKYNLKVLSARLFHSKRTHHHYVSGILLWKLHRHKLIDEKGRISGEKEYIIELLESKNNDLEAAALELFGTATPFNVNCLARRLCFYGINEKLSSPVAVDKLTLPEGIIKRLTHYRDDYINTVPEEPVDWSKIPNNFKVRKNWWDGPVGEFCLIIANLLILDRNLSDRMINFLTTYTSREFNTRLTTAQDIAVANSLITDVVKQLENSYPVASSPVTNSKISELLAGVIRYRYSAQAIDELRKALKDGDIVHATSVKRVESILGDGFIDMGRSPRLDKGVFSIEFSGNFTEEDWRLSIARYAFKKSQEDKSAPALVVINTRLLLEEINGMEIRKVLALERMRRYPSQFPEVGTYWIFKSPISVRYLVFLIPVRNNKRDPITIREIRGADLVCGVSSPILEQLTASRLNSGLSDWPIKGGVSIEMGRQSQKFSISIISLSAIRYQLSANLSSPISQADTVNSIISELTKTISTLDQPQQVLVGYELLWLSYIIDSIQRCLDQDITGPA